MCPEKTILVQMQNMSKAFGRIQALQDVHFCIHKDEIVGLIGDNGAGKSTLMKILVGALLPDEGEILFEGKRVTIENPREARELGIEIIYQNSALIDNASVEANIFLGEEPKKPLLGGILKVVDRKKMYRESWRVLGMVKSTVKSLKTEVQYLSGGQQKTVAIGRAILHRYKLVIMDEPTAGLGVKEVGKLLGIVRQLKEQGTAVVYITHRLEDLFAIADRVVVLRGGTNAGERAIHEVRDEDLIKMMVGSNPTISPNAVHR
jgi:simple sugar transport system ATP-binding protein